MSLYRGRAAHRICNLKYNVPEKISTVVQNGFNYDYHSIIKVLAEEFKKQSTCLTEYTAKYINFTVSIEKLVIRIDKNREEITKNISYILKCIDSARLMASSWSNLVNDLSEGIHINKCRYIQDDTKRETFVIK